MLPDWTIVPIGEVGISLLDCDHRTPPASENGYPYIAIPQLKQGRLDLSDVRRIAEDDFIDWTRRTKPQANDVILSRRCNPGETAFIPEGLECALGQNLVLLRSDGKQVYPPLLRWLVRSPDWWEQIRKYLNVGAVFDSLKCADIPKFKLPIPPMPAQRTIASILGSLDDKIELNRKMNETLEATARAIYKSWFVNFDPVHARAAGKKPFGMDEATAALFPATFEDSAMGKIPKGWKIRKIGDSVNVVGGSTPSTSNPSYWDGGTIPFVTPKDLSGLASNVLLRTERKVTEEGLRQISSGLLPVGTLLLSSRAPIGYIAITEIPSCINQGFIAMICNEDSVSNHYLLRWTEANMETIIGNANGTTFLEISKGNFRPLSVILPDKNILTKFNQIGSQLHLKVVANLKENELLMKHRDTLLPCLLSGQIQIHEADKTARGTL